MEDLRGIAFRYHSVKYDFQRIAFGICGAVFNIGVDNESGSEIEGLISHVGDFDQATFSVRLDYLSREVVLVSRMIVVVGGLGLTSGHYSCYAK